MLPHIIDLVGGIDHGSIDEIVHHDFNVFAVALQEMANFEVTLFGEERRRQCQDMI